MNTKSFPSDLLHIYDFGLERRENEDYDYDNSNRYDYDGYLFQYTLSGQGCFTTTDTTTILTPGKAFIIHCPENSRYFLPKETSLPWEFFYIHFTGSLAVQFMTYIMHNYGNILSIDSSALSIQTFLLHYSKVNASYQLDAYENSNFLYSFLTLLLRDIEVPAHTQQITCVEQAIQWMSTNYDTQKNLTEMCLELGVSLSHLTRQFHRQKGITPMQYLTRIRLNHSLSLLSNTMNTIEEISNQCGFSNGNYYAKVFRKAYGLTPTEYRKQKLHDNPF